MSTFEKKCSNCIFCESANFGYGSEKYCDVNRINILDEKLSAFKCKFFKNRHINEVDGRYEIIDYMYLELKSKDNEVCCFSSNIDALNDFIEKPSNLYMMNVQLNEKNKNLKDFIDFFKSELPEVYKKMWKEYKKLKGCEKEDNDIK